MTYEEDLYAVQLDGMNLEHIHPESNDDDQIQKFYDKQIHDIRLAAVKQNGLALQFVSSDQTNEICIAAVCQNADAYVYVADPNDAILSAMITKWPNKVLDIEKPSIKILKIALASDPQLISKIQKLNHLTNEVVEELVIYAIESSVMTPKLLLYVNTKTKKIAITAVLRCPSELLHIPDTVSWYKDIVEIAFDIDPSVIRYITKPSKALCISAITFNPTYIKFVKLDHPDYKELANLAITKKSECIRYVLMQTDGMKLSALNANPDNIRYISSPNKEMQMIACKKNGMNILHIAVPDESVCLYVIRKIEFEMSKFDISGEHHIAHVNLHKLFRHITHSGSRIPGVIAEALMKLDPFMVQLLEMYDRAICFEALRFDPDTYRHIVINYHPMINDSFAICLLLLSHPVRRKDLGVTRFMFPCIHYRWRCDIQTADIRYFKGCLKMTKWRCDCKITA
jgi:hypothetical protein